MDITQLLGGLFSTSAVNAASKASGTSSSDVTSVLQAAAPSLLAGLLKNANSEEGEKSLVNALADHESSDSVTDLIKNADLSDGAKIIGHILGSEEADTKKAVAKQTGVSQKGVSSILSSIAPALMTLVGGLFNKSGSSSITSLLSGLLGTTTQKSSGLDLASIVGGLFGGSDKSDSSGGLDLGNIAGALFSLTSTSTTSKKTTSSGKKTGSSSGKTTSSGSGKKASSSGKKTGSTSGKKTESKKKDTGTDIGDIAGALLGSDAAGDLISSLLGGGK